MAKTAKRAVAAGAGSILYSTGLVPNPEASQPGPADTSLGDQLKAEDPWNNEEGDLFWDGSATTVPVAGCNRAAWAVVQLKQGDSAPSRVVRGTAPPCYPQTAQAAETIGLWAATTLHPPHPTSPPQGQGDSASKPSLLQWGGLRQCSEQSS